MSDPSIQTNPPAGGPVDPAIQATPPLDNAIAAGFPTPTPASGDPSARSALFIVFLVVVIDLLGFGIVLPLLPRYGEVYVGQWLATTGPEGAAATGGHDLRVGAVVGGLMAVFSLMQFIFAPLWGLISDRVGRRPILLIGLGGSVAFYALFGYASDLPAAEYAGLALLLLFISRIGAGVAGATISTAQAVVADCTPPERRKHGMALIGMAFGIGFTFGPLVAAGALFMAPDHHGIVGYCAAGLSLLALGLGLALLPETRHFGEASPLERKWFDRAAMHLALRNPAIGSIILAFFLTTLGFAMFEVTLSLLNKDALGLSDQHNSYVFTFVGFALALDQGVLYRILARKVSETTFMAVGMVLMGFGMASLAAVNWLATGPWNAVDAFWPLLALLLVSLLLAVTGFAFLTPSATALISRRSDPKNQGLILGLNQSASAFARILGPVVGLMLYFATPNHLLPYLVGGALMLLMLLLIPRIRRGGGESGDPGA
jgi:MFS transporter, DHA1 family, tetracycline resistance protein